VQSLPANEQQRQHYHRLTEKKICTDNMLNCVGDHPVCGDLSQRGLNPDKLGYDQHQPNGWFSQQPAALID